MDSRTQFIARLAAVAGVVVGCLLVLAPFVPAILFAAVACNASWPLALSVRRALGGRRTLAAFAMTALLVLLVIGPSTLLAASLAQYVGTLVDSVQSMLEAGPPALPAWLKSMPIVGDAIDEYWHRLMASREEAMKLLGGLLEPGRAFVVGAGKAAAQGVLQLVLAAFVGFFFYRDGEALVETTRRILARLAGRLGDDILDTVDNTVAVVVQGMFGTAAGQALVAAVGFLVAGVPGVLLLATATFFLSMVPIGPPLVWGGAALWLFQQGSIGWAVFMVLWGLLAVSSIDNFLKPYLISRRSSLPMLLIVFGVFGGIVAFGFISIFIGPPVLAVGLTLVQLWIARPEVRDAPSGPDGA